MIGQIGVGANVDPDLISKVFRQMETMLPEFASFTSVVNQLLQRLLHDFRMAPARLQTERDAISTQRKSLEELLLELGGERDDGQGVVDVVYA